MRTNKFRLSVPILPLCFLLAFVAKLFGATDLSWWWILFLGILTMPSMLQD